jgi:ribosomal protein S27AE
MALRKLETPESVSLGHIRSHGCRDLLVYCNSINCSHGVTMNANHMPDDTLIRLLGSRMVCTRCGYVGADVRPDWSPHVNKRHV